LGLPHHHVIAIGAAGLLHDVGKREVSREVLDRSGPLDEHQRAELAVHPEAGGRAIEAALPPGPLARLLAQTARNHHAHWDGAGWPRGLAGPAIPLAARIVAIADAYDAMTTQRPYNHPRTPADARQELLAGGGKHFDPDLVAVFVRDVVPEPR
jgi:putative two-component system response regulator